MRSECNGAAVGSKDEKCSWLVSHMAGKGLLMTTLNTDFHWLHMLELRDSSSSTVKLLAAVRTRKEILAYYRVPDVNKPKKNPKKHCIYWLWKNGCKFKQQLRRVCDTFTVTFASHVYSCIILSRKEGTLLCNNSLQTCHLCRDIYSSSGIIYICICIPSHMWVTAIELR